jgi:hypothetical protein
MEKTAWSIFVHRYKSTAWAYMVDQKRDRHWLILAARVLDANLRQALQQDAEVPRRALGNRSDGKAVPLASCSVMCDKMVNRSGFLRFGVPD